MIGLDTSHAVAFTKLLNNTNEKHHMPGGIVVVAFPGGSPNFELSISRVEGFTEQLRTRFNVKILNSIEQVAAESDAILLESADGAVHHEQLRRIVAYKKPVFIDKPFSLTPQVANDMIQLAADYQKPMEKFHRRITGGLALLFLNKAKAINTAGSSFMCYFFLADNIN